MQVFGTKGAYRCLLEEQRVSACINVMLTGLGTGLGCCSCACAVFAASARLLRDGSSSVLQQLRRRVWQLPTSRKWLTGMITTHPVKVGGKRQNIDVPPNMLCACNQLAHLQEAQLGVVSNCCWLAAVLRLSQRLGWKGCDRMLRQRLWQLLLHRELRLSLQHQLRLLRWPGLLLRWLQQCLQQLPDSQQNWMWRSLPVVATLSLQQTRQH